MIRDDEYYYNIAKKSVPTRLSNDADYKIFLKLLAHELKKSDEMIDKLENAYDPEDVDLELLSRLADTLKLDYPITNTNEQLRFLLRYFKRIIKSRGSEKAIRHMVRVISHDEATLCSMPISELNRLEIEEPRDGTILIKYDDLPDYNFVKYMMRFVVDAGYEVGVNSKDHNSIYSSDSAISSEKQTTQES